MTVVADEDGGRPSVKASCWVCGAGGGTLWKQRNLERHLEPADFQITDRRYGVTLRLLKCGECGFIYADDDEVGDLVELYKGLEDEQYEETSSSRALQMKWLLKKASEHVPSATSLLDIGAGTGLLVAEARRMGLDAVGVEPSQSLVAAARELNQVDLLQGTFPHPETEGQEFDLIFLVDVIEHVAQPLKLLRQCGRALSGRGRMIVVTPDVSSLLARVLRRRWWHFRLAHVGYFNKKTLCLAAEQAGLQPARFLRAKWFFPVQYLAERLSSYLPIGWINKIVRKTPGLRWLYSRVVPLDLHDSWAVILQRK